LRVRLQASGPESGVRSLKPFVVGWGALEVDGWRLTVDGCRRDTCQPSICNRTNQTVPASPPIPAGWVFVSSRPEALGRSAITLGQWGCRCAGFPSQAVANSSACSSLATLRSLTNCERARAVVCLRAEEWPEMMRPHLARRLRVTYDRSRSATMRASVSGGVD